MPNTVGDTMELRGILHRVIEVLPTGSCILLPVEAAESEPAPQEAPAAESDAEPAAQAEPAKAAKAPAKAAARPAAKAAAKK